MLFPAEASFDAWREDKGSHTGGVPWSTLRMLRVPQATKQGAKGARLSSQRRNYDPAGNLDQLTYPGNKTVYYTYDELNRLHTVTIGWITPNPVATYEYDEAGRLTDVAQFNGSLISYGYDNANRLISMENRKSDSTILATYAFTLDGNGNRTNTTQTEQYTNLPSYSTTSYTYNLQKNRLLSAGSNSFTYDDEGQVATGYGSSYTFDYEHRLTAIGTTQFSYDGSGNRLQATRGGVITRYIYDASGNLLAEADGSNNITRYYIHGAGLLATVTPSKQLVMTDGDGMKGSTMPHSYRFYSAVKELKTKINVLEKNNRK